MTTTDLRDQIARQLNEMGWTYEGSHDPGDYDTCPDCREVADALAEFLAPLIAREKAEALRKFADATRMPFVVFRREDGSPVYVGELMRETADRIEKEADRG